MELVLGYETITISVSLGPSTFESFIAPLTSAEFTMNFLSESSELVLVELAILVDVVLGKLVVAHSGELFRSVLLVSHRVC